MKKFLTVVMAVLLGTTLAFAQGTTGSSGKNGTTSASGKKGRRNSRTKKGHRGKVSAKTHKGGKKGAAKQTPK